MRGRDGAAGRLVIVDEGESSPPRSLKKERRGGGGHTYPDSDGVRHLPARGAGLRQDEAAEIHGGAKLTDTGKELGKPPEVRRLGEVQEGSLPPPKKKRRGREG